MHAMLELALIADGWWLRSEIIWAKPNAMPESVSDRPTSAHEYILMLTKKARYWYDAEAVREGAIHEGRLVKATGSDSKNAQSPDDHNDRRTAVGFTTHDTLVTGRNMRSVWTFPTAQTPEAHFATFPTKLPRRCIEASTPRAICTQCGAARVRLVEAPQPPSDMRNRETDTIKALGDKGRTRVGGGQKLQDWYEEHPAATTGWSVCACESPTYTPSLVLDCFKI